FLISSAPKMPQKMLARPFHRNNDYCGSKSNPSETSCIDGEGNFHSLAFSSNVIFGKGGGGGCKIGPMQEEGRRTALRVLKCGGKPFLTSLLLLLQYTGNILHTEADKRKREKSSSPSSPAAAARREGGIREEGACLLLVFPSNQ